MSEAGSRGPRRQGEETRALIVSAAEQLLRERRVRDLRIDEVMTRAAVSRTAFYRHFDDLYDLVLGAARPAFDEVLDLQRSLFTGTTSLAEGIASALTALVQVYDRHGPMVRAIVDAAVLDPRVERVLEDYVDRFTADGRLFFELAGHPAGEAGELSRALVLMNLGYLVDRFSGPSPGPTDPAIATLTAVWTAALARRT